MTQNTTVTAEDVARLEAAWREAQKLAHETNRAAYEAKQAYRDAMLQATGLVGHVVEYEGGYGRKREKRRFVVQSLGQWGDSSVAGPMVKKDGTKGERELSAGITNVTDLGPYQEPGK